MARRSRREPASLDWELDLLQFLAQHGMRVPQVVPCLDGHRHVRGVVVQHWLEGSPPRAGDWPAVAAELRRLHVITRHWSQRPEFCASTDLLQREHGGDVDLTAMPKDAVDACRDAWRGIVRVPQAVVHGDPGAGNIRVSGEGIGLLDWDEARVDHVDLDLAAVPDPGLQTERLRAAQAALHAWEAANSWTAEPGYARHRLAALTGTN